MYDSIDDVDFSSSWSMRNVARSTFGSICRRISSRFSIFCDLMRMLRTLFEIWSVMNASVCSDDALRVYRLMPVD